MRGASRLAAAAKISPLVIGLTVVAFGTGAPELAVSLHAAWTGEADLAVGNVVGSNIANVLLILGVSALLTPLLVQSQLIRRDVPLMVAASFFLLVLSFDGNLSCLDGCFLFASLLIYTAWQVKQSRKESKELQSQFEEQAGQREKANSRTLAIQAALIVLGLFLLGFGSRWLVDGAVSIARLFDVDELIIGLTIVAVGTALPEVVTSIIASLRGQRDIAVGNIVGSNLFNILGVLGLSSILSVDGIEVSPAVLRLDLPVMVAVAFACLPIFFTGNVIARWEGGLFLGYYILYTTYLVLLATNASITRTFSGVMVVFVIPLTIITLMLGVVRSVRERRIRQNVDCTPD